VTSVAFGLYTLALLIPSVVLHELAHGYVSLRHGDPTARDVCRPASRSTRSAPTSGTPWTRSSTYSCPEGSARAFPQRTLSVTAKRSGKKAPLMQPSLG
jgi:hypothetical protein